MIICGECGTRNEPGTQFCTVCGTFLEWESTPAVSGASGSVAVGVPPVEPAGTGSVTTVDTPRPADPSDRTDPDAAARATSGADPTGAAAAALGTAGPSGAVATGASGETGPGTTGASGGAGSGTAGPPGAAAGMVGASGVVPSVVRPGDRRHRFQAAPTGEAPEVGPSEVVCPHCGVGNAASRKFCRACAGLLTAPVVVQRRSWWRRLIDALTRRRTHEAGTRRRVRAPRGWLRTVAIVAVLVAFLAALLSVLPTRGWIAQAVTDIRDRRHRPAPVTPVAIRASSAARGAAARNISDGLSNRYWAPSRGPVGAWVEADLPRPVRLLEVIVTSGVSADKTLFLAQGRPRELAVRVTDKAGKATSQTIVVQDKPGGQTFAVKVSDAVRIRFTIVSTYGMSRGRECAIGEVELFMRG